MKRIILVSGKAEHGKSTFASALQKNLPNSVVVNFADRLKRMCGDFLGWDGQKDEKGRKLLQEIGTEMIEEKGVPHYWVSSMLGDISLLSDKVDYVIIGDWRFKKEIYYMIEKIGHAAIIPIKVFRPGHISALTQEQLNHKSEVDLDDLFCITLENSSSMEELLDNAKWFAEKIQRVDGCEGEADARKVFPVGSRVLYQDLLKNADTGKIERVFLIGTISAIGPEGVLVDFDGALKDAHYGDMTEFATGERYPNGKPERDEPVHWFVDYDQIQVLTPMD